MSFTRRIRRQYDRNYRQEMIALAGQRYIAEQLCPWPHLFPRFA